MNDHEAERIAAAIHTDEDWRPIVGYELTYQVSDLGRIWSTPRPRTKGGLLKTTLDNHGYWRIGLVQGGRQQSRRVHILVMAAFVGPVPDGMEIRHLNGDSTDARFANLAYGTRAENVADTIAHGNHHRANTTHCPTGHPYDLKNTMVSGGRRYCRTCVNARSNRARRPR